jgi:hypothetical protein
MKTIIISISFGMSNIVFKKEFEETARKEIFEKN